MRSLSLLALFVSSLPLFAQGFTPDEAVKRMKLPDGFKAVCVAHEPMIRQPLSIGFDSRGRLWVLQYLQYPNPAGLKPVKQDQYLRTVWDKVPDAPPKGPKGLDRITICSEPDANGVFTKSKDFITGLNMASGFCLAPGGVYVVQPPYLLFYPDKNEDDVPDGDPEVLLSGFGMEDTHSLANSLQFGPDGWLYGAAGSTSTCKIKNPNDPKQPVIEFQQGVWRFHPKTKKFELFSEGGGNTYGLDFDRNGQCIAGTNWGGFAMLHHFQGAYYVKGFSKHGPLHNPYAYGYFDHVPYKNFKGGHVTCGGILYEADAYPKEYRGQYIAGNLLSNAVYWHKMTPKGASFTAEHGGELLEANDTWFRPVDLQLGPDGCVYVADWYDKRAAHLDPVDNWDKTNGRIYRIEYKGTKRPEPFDLRKKTSAELVDLLKHPNIWYRRQARELLSARTLDAGTERTLNAMLKDGRGDELEALWALHGAEKVTLSLANEHIKHENPRIREWCARFLTDSADRHDAARIEDFLTKVARPKIEHAAVYLQVACSAKRLSDAGRPGLAPLVALVAAEHFDTDVTLQHLVWWAAEARMDANPTDILRLIPGKQFTGNGAQFLLDRAIRRCLAENTEKSHRAFLDFADDIFRTESGSFRSHTALYAIDRAIEAGPLLKPERLREFLAGHRDRAFSDKQIVLQILAKVGDDVAVKRVREMVVGDKLPETNRLQWLTTGIKSKHPDLMKLPLELLPTAKSVQFQNGLLGLVEQGGSADTPGLLLKWYPDWTAAVKKRAVQALLSRPAWALKLFQAWDAGKFPKADLTVDHGRTAVQLGDKALTALVEKHFGKIAPATAGEKQARIAALNLNMSREKPGDPAKGKAVFTKTCAACHQLHGEGTKIGPDLTTADRKNRMYMLANIVDPSGYIRPEFISYTANTLDGRALTGMVLEQSPEAITLASYVNGKVEKAAIAKRDIDKLEPSPVSIMPEKLLDAMTDEEIRDLFAYLASDQKPLPGGRGSPERETKPAPGGGGDPKKEYKVGLVSGSLEYKSDDSLNGFAKLMEEKYPVECVKMYRKTDTDIADINKLADCDVVIFFTRRLTIDGDQLKAVKAYCESGKPIIGIRTASHGFQKWLDMDKEVFGGSYKGHFGEGLKCEVTIPEKTKDHPILKGVTAFASAGSLYKNPEISLDVKVLLNGAIPKETEPLAWVHERELKAGKQRVFYTSLGHPKDFDEASFRRLLVNAVGWCLKDEAAFAK